MNNDLHSFNPFVALGFGTFVGLIAQAIATRLRHNGKWDQITFGRKVALIATGALAAFGAGLWTLDHPAANSTQPYVYRLWFIQLVAAWGGTAFLDAAVQIFLGIVRNMGKGRDKEEDERGDA